MLVGRQARYPLYIDREGMDRGLECIRSARPVVWNVIFNNKKSKGNYPEVKTATRLRVRL